MRNTETGTEDYCFDFSDMFNGTAKDFSFMKVGKTYDCKILLFGEPYKTPSGERVLCRVTNDDVVIGNGRCVEVKVGKDIYYVPRSDVEDQLKNGSFFYYYSRKDLIMVDGIVNGYYLLDL